MKVFKWYKTSGFKMLIKDASILQLNIKKAKVKKKTS